jgi:thioredoxin-like negative regulator of GroEL
MAPIVDGLAKNYKGKVEVNKVNLSNDSGPAGLFGVNAVPTYVFLDATGSVIDRQEGGNPSALQHAFKKASGG